MLVKPSCLYKTSYILGIIELVEEGYLAGKLNPSAIEADFARYLQIIADYEIGNNIAEGFSPQSEFWLVNELEYLGTLKIKHRLGNEYLSSVGGHISYYIPPSKRKMGFGKTILKMGLEEAKKIGLKQALITCGVNNEGSRKIIEANGGVYEGDAYHDKTGIVRRYWFEL